MSDYPEALIEKVARGMAAWHNEDYPDAWSSWTDEAQAALDALGLREELLAGRETIDGYDETPWVRYVTEWEET